MNGFLADHKRGPADPELQTRLISKNPNIVDVRRGVIACLIRSPAAAGSFLGLILLGEAK